MTFPRSLYTKFGILNSELEKTGTFPACFNMNKHSTWNPDTQFITDTTVDHVHNNQSWVFYIFIKGIKDKIHIQ